MFYTSADNWAAIRRHSLSVIHPAVIIFPLRDLVKGTVTRCLEKLWGGALARAKILKSKCWLLIGYASCQSKNWVYLWCEGEKVNFWFHIKTSNKIPELNTTTKHFNQIFFSPPFVWGCGTLTWTKRLNAGCWLATGAVNGRTESTFDVRGQG